MLRISNQLIISLALLSIFNSSIAQQDSSKIKAKKGDGIFSILRENGLEPSIYISEFISLNKEKIAIDSSLNAGTFYLLPSKTKTKPKPKSKSAENTKMILPIFGEGHSTVNIKSTELENCVYYIISGHGGPDPGAISKYGPYTLSEDEYAYDVSLRLAKKMIEKGALVYMITRDNNDGIRDGSILKMDKDETVYPNKKIPLKQKTRLRQRTNAVNKLYKKHKDKYQRLLVLHVDSRSTGQNIDVFFYHHSLSKSGKKMCNSIHKTFTKKYKRHQPKKTYRGTVSSRDNLYVIKNTTPPTTFIELGNIRNIQDQRRFVLSNNRQALANWICEGVVLDKD